ncbi:short-chain dehydrogenase/reductase family Oxidoreductase, partial [Colletotrichum asianum]
GVHTRRLILDKSPEIEPQNLQWVKIDLTDMRSITAAVDWLQTRERKVDILIHNAAAATWSTEPVGAGWEPHMAVNFIGPFALTNRLLPLLQNAAAEKEADRLQVHLQGFNSPDCLRNPVPSHPWQWRYLGKYAFGFDMIRYEVSKATNLMFAQMLQRRLEEQALPIVSVAVHPGEVATEGVFSVNNAMVRTIARLTFLSPEQGAANPVFAAASRDVKENPAAYKGRFLLPVGKIGVPASVASDEDQVGALEHRHGRNQQKDG